MPGDLSLIHIVKVLLLVAENFYDRVLLRVTRYFFEIHRHRNEIRLPSSKIRDKKSGNVYEILVRNYARGVNNVSKDVN